MKWAAYITTVETGKSFSLAGVITHIIKFKPCGKRKLCISGRDNCGHKKTAVEDSIFGVMLERYGARVTYVKAATIGDVPSSDEVEAELGKADYKGLAVTHVDTSLNMERALPPRRRSC